MTDVQKASDLDGCERISSDLVIKSRNIDEITQNIIAVDGCISIVGTPLKSIDFLKLTDVSKAASTCKNNGQSGQFLFFGNSLNVNLFTMFCFT